MKSHSGKGSSDTSTGSTISSSSFSSISSSSSSSSSSSEVAAAATTGTSSRRSKSSRGNSSSSSSAANQFTSIFNVDGEKKIIVATETELLCVPYSPTLKVLTKGHLTKVPKFVSLPLSDICILSKKTSSTLLAHCLLGSTANPQGPREYRSIELTLVGPFASFRAPFTSDYDEPVEGWYKVLLARIHAISGDPAARKPILAIVNPYAGVKRAESVWADECAPLLSAAGLRYQTMVTGAPGDAYEAAKSMDSAAFSGIATVGGDGIFNEVINGLMARDDWEAVAGAVALASVPAGTGNGAAHTMYGSMDPRCAACHVVRAATHKADVYLAAQPSIGQYIWGILGCSYGIIAEADFGSEKIRWAGSMRPSIWAFYRILCGSAYNCRITYLPTETPRQEWHGVRCTRECKVCRDALKMLSSDYVDSEAVGTEDADSDNDENDNESENESDASKHGNEDEKESKHENSQIKRAEATTVETANCTQNTNFNDTEYDPAAEDAQTPVFTLGAGIKYHTAEPELSTVPSYGPAYTSSLTACRDWAGDVPAKYAKLFSAYPHNVVSSYTARAGSEDAGTSSTTTTNSNSSSNSAEKSLPKGWAELENRSLSFCSLQKLPWLMPGMFVAPYAHFLDGCMDISYALSESFSRITFMKLFSLFPDGSYLNNPKLSYLKVRAFTLEPLDNDGYIGIDGERIRYAPLHFHIVRALLNLLTYN